MDFRLDGNNFVLYLIDQIRYTPSSDTTTYSGGIFESADHGDSWQNITGNLPIDLTQLNSGGTAWGGPSTTYYNFIAKWFGITSAQAKNLYPRLPTAALQPMHQILVDPSDAKTLYVGLNDPQGETASFGPGPLWKTTDEGGSWILTTRAWGPAFENDKAYWQARNNPINQQHQSILVSSNIGRGSGRLE